MKKHLFISFLSIFFNFKYLLSLNRLIYEETLSKMSFRRLHTHINTAICDLFRYLNEPTVQASFPYHYFDSSVKPIIAVTIHLNPHFMTLLSSSFRFSKNFVNLKTEITRLYNFKVN